MSYRWEKLGTLWYEDRYGAFTPRQFRRMARSELCRRAKEKGLVLGKFSFHHMDGYQSAVASAYRRRSRRSILTVLKFYAFRVGLLRSISI